MAWGRGIPPLRKVREGMGHYRNSTASRECLSGFIALQASMGSFDCVGVRVANANFAQDDSGRGDGRECPSHKQVQGHSRDFFFEFVAHPKICAGSGRGASISRFGVASEISCQAPFLVDFFLVR